MKSVFTVTFGDVAENHVGNQQIGDLAVKGFSKDDLLCAKLKAEAEGIVTELVDLSGDAYILVLRHAVYHILGDDSRDELINEHAVLEADKKAVMYGRVVNKHARHNLCFVSREEDEQEPCYEEGKGRLVSFTRIPLTDQIRNKLEDWLGDTAHDLKGEANYYYDIDKCGIGYHGDTERRKVIAMRVGYAMTLYFRWYKHHEPISERILIPLNDGDMYIMSEKAVGNDWKRSSIPTLRHATGCDKFVK